MTCSIIIELAIAQPIFVAIEFLNKFHFIDIFVNHWQPFIIKAANLFKRREKLW